jgi:hypothetical protein
MSRPHTTALEEVLPVPPDSSLAVSISSSAAADDSSGGSSCGTTPRNVALDSGRVLSVTEQEGQRLIPAGTRHGEDDMPTTESPAS